MFSNFNHWHKVSAVTCLQRSSPVVLTHRFWLNISENIPAAKINSLFTPLPSCDNWEQTAQLWQAARLWDGDVAEVHWRGNTVRLLFALEQDQASSVPQPSLCLRSGGGRKEMVRSEWVQEELLCLLPLPPLHVSSGLKPVAQFGLGAASVRQLHR